MVAHNGKKCSQVLNLYLFVCINTSFNICLLIWEDIQVQLLLNRKENAEQTLFQTHQTNLSLTVNLLDDIYSTSLFMFSYIFYLGSRGRHCACLNLAVLKLTMHAERRRDLGFPIEQTEVSVMEKSSRMRQTVSLAKSSTS